MSESISFFVPGIAQPKGSTRAFFRPGMKYPVVTSDNPKNRPWEQAIRYFALANIRPDCPWDGAVWLSLRFVVSRPKSLPKRVFNAIKKPDLDKLTRSVGDSLKGVLYRDDSQIVKLTACKEYGDVPGVYVDAGMVTRKEQNDPTIAKQTQRVA